MAKYIGYLFLGFFLSLTACNNAEFCGLNASGPCNISNGQSIASSVPGKVEFIKAPDARLPVGTEQGFILLDTLFESGSDQLTPEFEGVLKDVGLYLLKVNPLKIYVNGHTDSVGSAASNLDLSQRRANTVTNFLISGGYITLPKTESTGYGESQPIDTNDTVEGRAKNRRVEIFLDLQ